MNGLSLKVLMIDEDIDFTQAIQDLLAEEKAWPVEIVPANTIEKALESLNSEDIHAILLDLSLQESDGMDTFIQVRLNANHTPIVLLSPNRDFWAAIQSVREGAQDYLLKGEVNGPLLARALYYAVERHHSLETLRQLSLLDELTGLYNRRGLLSLAEQHISLARRTHRDLVIFYVDLDGLKKINDQFGHLAGDLVLSRCAQVLRRTFRRSDIIGRVGGDEFVVVAIDTCQEKTEAMLARMAAITNEDNEEHTAPYRLSLTAGTQEIDLESNLSLEDWICKADQVMYERKRRKQIALQ